MLIKQQFISIYKSCDCESHLLFFLMSSCFRERVPTADTVYDSILLHHTPEDIVKELTLIDRGLLIQVNFDELLPHLNNSSSQQVRSWAFMANCTTSSPGGNLILLTFFKHDKHAKMGSYYMNASLSTASHRPPFDPLCTYRFYTAINL